MNQSARKQARNALEENINLETLMKLKKAFHIADEDGGGSLDVDEFVGAFRDSLTRGGAEHSEDDLRALFQKIDANCDGTVDWDEFSSYMLLENEGTTSLREREIISTYELPSTRDAFPDATSHRNIVSKMIHITYGDRIVTAGRDGAVKIWSGKDLSLVKTLREGSGWVTDICYMSRLSKLATCSFNRTIKVHDLLTSEVVTSVTDLEHPPVSLYSWEEGDGGMVDSDGESKAASGLRGFNLGAQTFVVSGDTGGGVNVYSLVDREHDQGLDKLDVNRNESDRYMLKHHRNSCIHSDWIGKVMYISDMSAVGTCSLDKTLCLTDLERDNVVRKLVGHTKGVYSFDWSPSFKFLASCGMDRTVLLWNPITRRPLHRLTGHTSAIQDVVVMEECNQIISLSIDKVIKVWDIRNHRCLQTITDKTAYRPENKIGGICKDNIRHSLLTAALRPKLWTKKTHRTSNYGHNSKIVSALHNGAFKQIVSSDQSGSICVWDLNTGRLKFRFTETHGASKLTTMTFDTQERRLITGAHDGTVKMWNFSNGATLKAFQEETSEDGEEISGLIYSQSGTGSRHIIAVGWAREIIFWEDDDKKVSLPCRKLLGHTEDILCVAQCQTSALATGSYDGMIIIWNVDSGAVKYKLMPPEYKISKASSSSSSEGSSTLKAQGHFLESDNRAIECIDFLNSRPQLLLATGADGMLRLWNTVDGQLMYQERGGHKEGEAIVSLTITSDDSIVATGDTSGIVLVNKTLLSGRGEETKFSTKLRATWKAHVGAVTTIAIVEEDKVIVTGGSDSRLVLWDYNGAKCGEFGSQSQWNLYSRSTWETSEC